MQSHPQCLDAVVHALHTKACAAYQSGAKRALIMQVLALFAGQPYDSELQNLGNLDAHLTNTCRLGEVEEKQAVLLLSELPQVSHL